MTDLREQGRVALFIDWDNLQISTQNDYQDRPAPDLGTIVQKAQEYGQIIVARAYAEWHRHEERLEIYRQGVEPVYAPVFRFEPEPSNPSVKGKSLADPVMVSECIDFLHLLPNITTYVLVTGDKDLIPVVRLVKLRGKRTILIAPEYVARELEKMVDEVVWYRDLIGAPAQTRMPGHQRAQQARLAAESARAVAGRAATPRPISRQAQPVARADGAVRPEATPIDPAVLAAATAPAPNAPEGLETLDAVYAAMTEILQKMAGQGKTKVRATNLKDKLLERSLNFSEKHYGFSKFKDLLFAAQRAGVLTVTSSGPVQWVQLPGSREEAEPAAPAAAAVAQPAAAPQPAAAAPGAAVSAPRPTPAPIAQSPARAEETEAPRPAPAAPAAEEAGEPMEFEPRQRDQIIRFIDELRERSRWLTYTYVLTNVTTYLRQIFEERGLPEAEADAEARGILNYLVNLGVLRVDKEPREVDVNGVKHRIRMCHLEETNPYVVAALRDAQRPDTGEEEVESDSAGAAEAAPETAGEPPAAGEAATEAHPVSREESLVAAPVAALLAGESEGRAPETEPAAETAEGEGAPEGATRGRSRRGRSGRRGRGGRGGEEAAASVNGNEGAAEPARPEAPAPVAEPTVAIAPTDGAAPTAAPANPNGPDAALTNAFDALVDVVRQATRAGGGPVKASGLKLRLGRRFGSFDERRFGFARFSDFLEAAEREGRIRVSTNGQGAFVSLPAGEE